MAGQRVLEHNAARADLQRLNDLLRGDGRSKKQNLGRRLGPFMMARIASRPGKRGMETSSSKNVGLQFEGLGDGFVAVAGVAHHIKAFAFRQHVAHANAHHRVIVCHHNTNRSIHGTACLPDSGLGRQFSIQHTLQGLGGGAQIAEQRPAVIQMVIFGCWSALSSNAPSRAACMAPAIPQPPLMAWPMRRISSLSRREIAALNASMRRIRSATDGRVNLAHRLLRHQLPQLAQHFGADHRIVRIQERRASAAALPVQQLAQGIGVKWLQQQSIARRRSARAMAGCR